MIHSMTGFGKASCHRNGTSLSVELTSVNHRYLEPSVRLPSEWAPLDPLIRETLKKHLSRGKITIVVRRKRGGATGGTVKFDTEVAREYILASKELGSLLGTDSTLDLNTLAQFNGVFFSEEDEDNLEEAKALLITALEEALDNLDAMRALEGEVLREEMAGRITLIRESLKIIEAQLPEIAKAYEERLRSRISELSEDTAVTEDRIALEAALIAEKGDVTEEVVRLKAHLDHGSDLLEEGGAIGRKFNFLTQEMQREINTLGSKVRDSAVTREVLQMKAELEKIREQIQNVE